MLSPVELLAFVSAFQVKHFLADYVWQTQWMLAGKGKYGHPGGLAHAGLHGAVTWVILAAAVAPVVALLVALAEAALHYHIDFLKERVVSSRELRPAVRPYWIVTGADQAAHQFTYAAIFAFVSGVR